MNVEQFSRSSGRPVCKHRVQRAAVSLDEKLQQAPQPPGLDAEIAGRPDQLLQFLQRHLVQGVRIEQVGLAEIADRPLDVLPTRVLRQHRADHHLKGRLARPPVLGTEGVEQPAVDFGEHDGMTNSH